MKRIITNAKSDGFGHEKAYEGETNDWITPKWIIDAFNKQTDSKWFFDLDPCACIVQPWNTAKKSYTKKDDGLNQKWTGAVYCNPPYGPHAGEWMRKLAKHGNGVALIFARTETQVWQDDIFPNASGFLWIRGRLVFCRPNGKPATNKSGQPQTSGAPSVLVSFGYECRNTLINMVDDGSIPGAFTDAAFYTGSKRY